MERLREIVLEGNHEWRDNFSDYDESLDDEQLETVLTRFIEDVVRNPLYGFETFVEIYEITSAV